MKLFWGITLPWGECQKRPCGQPDPELDEAKRRHQQMLIRLRLLESTADVLRLRHNDGQ